MESGPPPRPVDGTLTSTELLAGLRDPANHTLWNAYVDRYRPLIVRTARRMGLAEHDAEDVAQSSLVDFSKAYVEGRYDRERGRLRDWLAGIVRNRVRSHRRSRGRERPAAELGGETALVAGLEAPDELERVWEEEWRREILRQGMALVRREVQASTFDAFQRYVVEGRSSEEVAADLGLDVEAVYDAKRRVLRRLRELQPVLEDSW